MTNNLTDMIGNDNLYIDPRA